MLCLLKSWRKKKKKIPEIFLASLPIQTLRKEETITKSTSQSTSAIQDQSPGCS